MLQAIAASCSPMSIAAPWPDLLGAVLTGLARMSASAGDQSRYSAAVDVLVRFVDGTLLVDN